MKDLSDAVVEEHYRWSIENDKHRIARIRHYTKTRALRKAAHKRFYKEHRKWFKTLDTIGIILIALNILAIILTGLLVVKTAPTTGVGAGFVEANPVQCKWNGFSCTTKAWDIITPVLKQMIFWAVLVSVYLYMRSYVYSEAGMWALTAIIILYVVGISIDTANDLGLYIGKLLFGKVIR